MARLSAVHTFNDSLADIIGMLILFQICHIKHSFPQELFVLYGI